MGILRARSNMRDWEGLCKCLEAKFPGPKWVALEKGLLLALVRDLTEVALTLLEKYLYAVIHESEEEIEETGLETVDLSRGEKSAWFNLKDTDILEVFINWSCFLLVILLKWVFWPFVSSVAVIIDSDSWMFFFLNQMQLILRK